MIAINANGKVIVLLANLKAGVRVRIKLHVLVRQYSRRLSFLELLAGNLTSIVYFQVMVAQHE